MGVSKSLSDDCVTLKHVDGLGRIIASTVSEEGTSKVHTEGIVSNWLADGGETWTEVVDCSSKSRKKRKKKALQSDDASQPKHPAVSVPNVKPKRGGGRVMRAVWTNGAMGDGVLASASEVPGAPPICAGARPASSRPRIRAPRTAAVLIKYSEDASPYADIVGLARSKINLTELAITDTRIRKAQTNGILVEIPGEDSGPKADELSKRLEIALHEHEDRISVMRPIRKSEIRFILIK